MATIYICSSVNLLYSVTLYSIIILTHYVFYSLICMYILVGRESRVGIIVYCHSEFQGPNPRIKSRK